MCCWRTLPPIALANAAWLPANSIALSKAFSLMDNDFTNKFVIRQQTFLSAPNTKYFVMETLANRVEKRMKELGWTQSDLARRVGHGVKPQNIQQLLDGTVKQPRYIAEL